MVSPRLLPRILPPQISRFALKPNHFYCPPAALGPSAALVGCQQHPNQDPSAQVRCDDARRPCEECQTGLAVWHSSPLARMILDSKPYAFLKAHDESYKNHIGFAIIRASGEEQYPPTSSHVRATVLSSRPERVNRLPVGRAARGRARPSCQFMLDASASVGVSSAPHRLGLCD